MNAGMKAGLTLAITFLLGASVGAFGAGAIAQRRGPPPGGGPGRPEGPGPRGFVEMVEEVIRPRDDAQRTAVRALLEQTDRRNRTIVDGARDSMRSAMDSLHRALAP